MMQNGCTKIDSNSSELLTMCLTHCWSIVCDASTLGYPVVPGKVIIIASQGLMPADFKEQ